MTAGRGHAWRPDIQGLRAVAVLLVVLSHANVRGLGGGYVGVDVFFVISGFLITSLLARDLAATGSVSLRRFYARRALRLLPAATLVAVVTLVGAWLYLSRLRLEEYTLDALASIFYVVNLRLADAEVDYLSEGTPPSPFQHFWSLAVEEQFYLVWPLLLLLGWRLAGRRPGVRRRVLLVVPLAVVGLASFALSVRVTGDSASWAYFGSHTRAWELGVGSLLGLAAGRLGRVGRAGRLSQLGRAGEFTVAGAAGVAMAWAGLAAILLAAVSYDDGTPFPGFHALLPVAGAALVLAGGCVAPARLLSWGPLTWLGGLSYGWYLWHWPLLLIGPSVLDRPASVPQSLALSALALLLAWLTLHLVENPVRFHAAFRRRPGRGLGLGVALSAGSAAMALAVAAFAGPIPTAGPAAALRAELADAPDPRQRLGDLLEQAGTRLPSNLSPPLANVKAGRTALYRDGCHSGYGAVRPPASATCVYGDPDSETVVALHGDSHAAQWFPALERLARAYGWKLVAMTKASCKVPTVTTILHGKPYEACDAWRENARAAIAAHDPDLVIVSNADGAGLAYEEEDPDRQWARGYRDAFRRLGALGEGGTEVAVILDNPWPKEDAVECAAANPMRLDDCAHRLPDAHRDPTLRQLARDVARQEGVAVIDSERWLCSSNGDCPVVVRDTVVYRDDNHLTDAYAENIAPVVGDALQRFLVLQRR